jgi:hypothetical protein
MMTTTVAVNVVALTMAAARTRLVRAAIVAAHGSEHATRSKKYSRYLPSVEATHVRACMHACACISVSDMA